MPWLNWLFGRPLRTSEERGEKLGAASGIPIFGLDTLGSAAYGPEAALTLLIPLGAAGISYIIPISICIIILLSIVYFSYRQTIEAYPTGGGSYTVARENLGSGAGLAAASALMIAQDGYPPIPFATRGRRLVYSQGIMVLAVLCGILLIIFGGVTDRLIPLFAVGTFLAFTLSQSGTVAHWRKRGGKKARHSIVINGMGAVATATTALVVTFTKFVEGAWVTTLLIPAIIILMLAVRRHYDRVDREISNPKALDLKGIQQPLVVMPILGWNKVTEKGLRFALELSPDVHVLHVVAGEENDELRKN